MHLSFSLPLMLEQSSGVLADWGLPDCVESALIFSRSLLGCPCCVLEEFCFAACSLSCISLSCPCALSFSELTFCATAALSPIPNPAAIRAVSNFDMVPPAVGVEIVELVICNVVRALGGENLRSCAAEAINDDRCVRRDGI